MNGPEHDRSDEPDARTVAELLDQISRRTRRLRGLEAERDELERRLAAQQAAHQAALRRAEDRVVRLERSVEALRQAQADRTLRRRAPRLLRSAERGAGPAGTGRPAGAVEPPRPQAAEPRYPGYLDVAECRRIAGWAWDPREPDRRLTVEILDGDDVVTTVVADRPRPDLAAAGIGDGAHAFSTPTPSSLKDGGPHDISARVAGADAHLRGAPKRIVCQPEPDDLMVGSRSLSPVSRRWGFERGTPIDRRYIEDFLARHREDVRGRVLEIGDDGYTRRFGGDRVTRSDVLNLHPGDPATTIVADLADAGAIPDDTFDAAIITQTLQLVYEVRGAVRTLHRILRPGGVVLATVPGITPVADPRWGPRWCWTFTERSIRLLFEEAFRGGDVTVESHGNVLAAASFLYGLTAEDLTWEELGVHDPSYPVTIAVRAVKARAASRRGNGGAASATHPAAVLLYHRVADPPSDPWGLTVHPDRFLEQLEALGDAARVVPLSELDRAVRSRSPRPTVAVTFDDGYRDVLAASAVLREHQVPATFFLVSGALGRELWWDELERLLLRPGELPARVTLWAEEIPHSWRLGEAATYSEDDHARHLGWRALRGEDPSARHRLFRSVHALLRGLPEWERERAMDQVRGWMGAPGAGQPEARALSTEEVGRLAAEPAVEVGAHSLSHPALPAVSHHEQRREIDGSKRDLEELLGSPVRAFSYPFGVADDRTAALVHGAGFAAAWTASARPVLPDADPARMGRFTVGDWSGEELARRLADWTTP